MADRFNPRGAPVAGPDPYEGWELVARNPFLPIGEYRNALGDIQAGFAAPSMVSEPARAFADLIDTPAGTMPNPQNEDNQRDALTGLMSFYGGNAMSGMARGAGARAATHAPYEPQHAFRLRPELWAEDDFADTVMNAGTRLRYSPGIDGGINIKSLETPAAERGRGQARALMTDITHQADIDGVPLSLDAQAWGGDGTNVRQLRKFYRSLGFSDDGTGFMTRQPSGGGLFSDTSKPNPLGAGIAAQSDSPGIIAYHGSPHDFDRFDMGKTGTGEGAQAYGHGLYFAENEGVAKSYKTTLSGDPFPDGDARNGAWHVMNMRGEDAALQYLRKFSPHNAASAFDDVKNMQRGHMYQVRINANPEDFLEWDKPLSQQSERVRGALSAIGHGVFVDSNAPLYGSAFVPKPEELSAYTRAGIPGIRYLDQMSRSAGDGTSNYVVFDDSLIEILKKYGLIPATYGAAQMLSEDDGYTTY